MSTLTVYVRRIAFVTASLLTFSAQSQLPDSIAITTNGSWIIRHSETVYGWNPQTNTYEYTTTNSYAYYRSGGDTLIGGNTYTKLLGLPITPVGEGSYTSSPIESEYCVLAYRNDLNRKAYMVQDGMTNESLWYDFSLDVGDTLWNPVTLTEAPYYVVSERDSINFCGTNYENFHYSGSPYHSTQRVGSSLNFFHYYQDYFIADIIEYF